MSIITATLSSTHKRKTPPADEVEDSLPTKKSYLEERIDSLTDRCVAKVYYHSDYGRASANCAYLSTRLYNKLFGRQGENGQHVKIANLIFRALRDPMLANDNIVDVNFVAHGDIKGHLFDSTIWVDPVDIQQQKLVRIKQANFVVSACGNLNGIPDAKNTVLASTLETMVRDRFSQEALTLNQSLFIMHPTVGPLKVVLDSWEPAHVTQDKMLIDGEIPYFGLVKSKTRISFESDHPSELLVVDAFDSKKIDTFHFQIKKTHDVSERVFSSSSRDPTSKADWKKGIKPLPLAIPFPDLAQKVVDRFTKKPLLLGRTESFAHNPDWTFDVEFSKVTVVPSWVDHSGPATNNEGNVKMFQMKQENKKTIGGTSEVILTTDPKNARKAEKLTFEILDMVNELAGKDNAIPWVSVEEIENIIKSEKEPLAVGEKRVITIGPSKYLLELIKASGASSPKPLEYTSLHDIWAVNKDTQIAVYPKSSLDLQVVDTPHIYVLDALTVKISAKSSGGGGSILSMLTGGTEEEDSKKTVVPEDEAKQIFLESLPSDGIIHAKQTFKGLTGKGERVHFKLDKLKCEELEGKNLYRGCMYKCGPKTQIIIDGEKDSDVIITTKPAEINLGNIDQKLLEYGIGGMSEQFKDVIARTTLSRSSFASHVATLGQKPSRGLLLYGPPGTGKTLLARQLGKILGVTGERIKLFTGSQIWNKWLGESEKNVRNMFKEAREDQNRYGKNSPLHLLIIDEIDAFLQDRANAERRYETSVVNTFIAELDGLSSNGDDSLNNIIVIGLTNFPDRIDDAAKRPGRLFPHIHIGIPDHQGRKEIFEIHTKGMREGGFLAADVDMDELIQMTVGRVGAFIEGTVAVAAEYSLKRLWEQRVKPRSNQRPSRRQDYHGGLQAGVQGVSPQKEKGRNPCPHAFHTKAVG